MPRPSLIPYTAPARGGNGRSFSALPVELDTRQIIRSFDAASLEWEQFRSLHMEIYDYAIPNRQLFINDSPGARKTDKVFNSAAVKATQRLAGRLQQTIVPAFQTWVRLVPGNLVPTEHVNEVGKFLDHQTDVLFEFINASNFATAIHESLLDLTIGTGALLVQDGGLETPLEYHSVPIFELRPLEGPSGTIETVFRLRKPKLGNLLQIWPQATLPPELEQKIEARPNETVEIIEGVVHRPFFRDYVYVVLHRGAAGSEHASVMLATQMDLSPFIVFRWSKLAGETWGRGPLFDVLGDVRTCNELVRFTFQNAQMAIAPPILSTEAGIVNPATFLYNPGGINYVGEMEGVNTLKHDYRFDVSNLFVEKLEESIRKGMFVDELPPPEGGIRSATEIMIRQRNLAEEIGAAFGRLQSELLVKMVNKSIRILQHHGKMEPFVIDGRAVDVRFVGPLAQSQEREDVLAFAQFWEIAQSVNPQIAMLGVKVEDAIEYLGEKFDIPRRLLREESERKELEAMAAQAVMGPPGGAAAPAGLPGPTPSALPTRR